jgi:hypothetical protein
MNQRTRLALGACVVTSLFAAFASCVVTDEEHDEDGGGGVGGAGGDVITGPGGSGATSQQGGQGGEGGMTGNTIGVQCGPAVCQAPEVCCVVEGAPSCGDESSCGMSGGATSGEEVVVMTCDDAADCDGGACCVRPVGGLKTEYRCSSDPCELHESCSGGECSDLGDVCVSAPDEASQFKCVEADTDVTCGGTSCAGGAPVCCGDDSTCVAYGQSCDAAFECDGPDDCGGAACCGGASGAQCTGTCVGSSTFCATVDDCPPQGNQAAQACTATTFGPSGLKQCDYPGN